MHVEFNEFTCAFALLDSLPVAHTPHGTKMLPILPSTRAEAKLGYDARLDLTPCTPLFLQFKVCERMNRRSATGSRAIEPPFYRFKIWPGKKSAQHEALLALNRLEPFAYYVAPRFHQTEFLAYAHLSGKLPGYSLWVAPSAIGPLPDDLQHYVVYNDGGTEVYFCSQPRRIEAYAGPYFQEELGEMARRSPEEVFGRIREAVYEMNRTGEEILPLDDLFTNVIDDLERPMIQRLEWMVRHYFGCATVLIFNERELEVR
jgi:hypothetical protein